MPYFCLLAVSESLSRDAGVCAHKIQNMARKEICYEDNQLTMGSGETEHWN